MTRRKGEGNIVNIRGGWVHFIQYSADQLSQGMFNFKFFKFVLKNLKFIKFTIFMYYVQVYLFYRICLWISSFGLNVISINFLYGLYFLIQGSADCSSPVSSLLVTTLPHCVLCTSLLVFTGSAYGFLHFISLYFSIFKTIILFCIYKIQSAWKCHSTSDC